MKNVQSFVERLLALVCLLVPTCLMAQPGVPPVFPTSETAFQAQTHFLVFLGSTAGENAATATAYYNAIDPTHSKRTFTQWLVNAGFIQNESQWNSTGPQIVACDLGPAAGCDVPKHNPDGSLKYGTNILNADAHAIVLNAADLGFVRNQYVRCVPDCKPSSNPKIYTYLENYPVNPFAASGNGGSGFPKLTGYPTTGEAAAAISSALNRPPGNLAGCDPTKTDTAFGCKISRIADVAFEWSPPPTNPNSSSRYGKLYSYIFDESTGTPTETIAFPGAGGFTPNLATGTLQPFNGSLSSGSTVNSYTGTIADPFPPNLDFIGNKQHPGVCFICHGGQPQKLTSTGTYPNQGNVNGFRLLPLDIRNLLFTSDAGGEQPGQPTSIAFTDRAHQELQIKSYNQAVLDTVPTFKEGDGTGSTRVAHLREVILGWYAGSPGDQTMSGNVQNGYWQSALGRDFIPGGWLESKDGGPAPPGSEHLYQTVVSPSCRSCHFNREISLDFGTAANFQQESDLLQLALLPDCSVLRPSVYSPDPKGKYMPLAYLTFQRFWQANQTVQTLPYPSPGLNLFNTAEQIGNYFGFNGTAGYCATNP